MARFTLIRDDNTQDSISLSLSPLQNAGAGASPLLLEQEDRIAYVQMLAASLAEGKRVVLFDTAMRHTAQKARAVLRTSDLSEQEGTAVFFTSGTTGNPVGVLKTAAQLEAEMAFHRRWISERSFEQCLVCVPMFHIYGFLFGFALPLRMDLDILTQEHFLPGDIVDHALSKATLCISNPVFVRAMNRLGREADLSRSLFVCSAGALEPSEAETFERKYNTTLVQLYGSTETGGIAIRSGGEERWTPLEGVEISRDEGRLCVASPYLSHHLFDETCTPLSSPYRTGDLVRIEEGRFEIVGRESELIKIGGKRLSVVEIEQALEGLEGISEVLASLEYRPGMLRGEVMHLKMRTDTAPIDAAMIKKFLHDRFGGIHIECKIERVEHIPKTATGKKIRAALRLG